MLRYIFQHNGKYLNTIEYTNMELIPTEEIYKKILFHAKFCNFILRTHAYNEIISVLIDWLYYGGH